MARQLSGSGQYIGRTNPTGLAVNAAWTWMGWVWLDATAVNQTLCLIGTPTTLATGLLIKYEDTDRIEAVWDAGAGSMSLPASGLTAGVWTRVALTHAGAGSSLMALHINGTSIGTDTPPAIPELASGDVVRFGSANGYDYYTDWDGRIAWSAWVQGVALTAAQTGAYLNSPCDLLTDYGPSGVVTANALKGLWPFQPADPGQDISGVGNTLTNTSTTDVADPGGLPTSCGGGGSVALEGTGRQAAAMGRAELYLRPPPDPFMTTLFRGA